MRLLLCLVVSLAPAAASADWQRWSGGASGAHLVDVSSPDGEHVFTGGFTVVLAGGYIPELTNYVYASSDGGQSFNDVTGDLAGGLLEGVSAVHFVNAQLGFVGIGSQIHKTTTGGSTWVATEVGCTPAHIHFQDSVHGAATCPAGTLMVTSDGGLSWHAVATGVSTDLNRMFWLGTERGWISAYVENEDSEGNVDYTDGVVLRTNDGGATWSASTTIDDRGLGKLFFLSDGQTGWLSAWQWINAERNEAHLYRTTDGGQTFTDMGLPLQVGTIQSLMSGPLNTYGIAAMYWSDALHGHLGGSAFIVKTSDSQSGDKEYWRNVDYLTADGGATWQKSDLGVIEVDLFGGTPIASDGAVMAGHMTGLYEGWMVGEKRTVWGYEMTCVNPGDCATGYQCTAGTCVAIAGDDGGSQTGGDAGPIPGGDSDSTNAAPGAAKEFEEGGCNAAPVPAGAFIAMVSLLLSRRRRSRSTHR